MFLSVFDIFKIGIGPSSSHTMGPMVAASRFLKALAALPGRTECRRLTVSLHGSLAYTGKGHATDRAVFLGLMGFLPDTLDPDQAEALVAGLKVTRNITAPGIGAIAFDPDHDLVFDYGPPLPGHANGMVFTAHGLSGNVVLREVWYSIGGGFVVSEDQLSSVSPSRDTAAGDVPYPFTSAVEMLRMGRESGLPIAAMKEANERVRHGRDLEPGLERLQAAMNGCIDRGLSQEGILPGGLSVRRRAKGLHQQLLGERGSNRAQPHAATDWLLVYAMAVNEENAAGGRVVTAPTNGAAGVVPAVLRYYSDHCVGANADGERQFLLTAAAIGGLIKHRASISGAECGCQAEIGSASAMAAAGLCAALGGTNEQIENAAEIALEHHLGMTCDPAGGLVQVPCIERNGLGAIKAVSAASLALRGDGQHFMPLDNCIETMRQTGQDMATKYKETSLGGLAVNLPEC
ncbi:MULTISPECIES: L-serine ammonia-lyase [Aminobacter]|uniref:L-serine dehydratase n=1 Tax=Aminobacter ciceronei TaxID=150723 RepID=A0ABR6BZL6_9HYPH|nr:MULTISPECIES: L-serine ammonia-lyase [Aminobacter]MBA8904386.1 L-serine dehydratase [Aminobacter ciceronei]MBA9018164.1 L-serine dehydratase [Aminobacter ciceronei]MRX33245.1 L-serine ammonia-lyase [Aminobacter sp. MDW-2]QNH36863.1 L-serine ammonia-lyase [Aminobacter sp. MDW-2]